MRTWSFEGVVTESAASTEDGVKPAVELAVDWAFTMPIKVGTQVEADFKTVTTSYFPPRQNSNKAVSRRDKTATTSYFPPRQNSNNKLFPAATKQKQQAISRRDKTENYSNGNFQHGSPHHHHY